MSMSEQVGGDNANTLYLSIIGWNMVQKVEEGTLGAKRRDYETSDGNTGTKYEISHKNLVGKVAWLSFVDGSFGEQFILTLTNWEDQAKLHINTDSKYFTAFARKLPNIKLEENITLNSFDFTTNDGKRITGMDIKQGWEKVEDNYWDGKKTLNGMPEVTKTEAKGFDKDDWKMHFMKVKKFLKKEVEAVVIPTNIEDVSFKEAEGVFKETDDFE